MNKPTLQDKDKVATVYNSKGEVCETFSFRDHGNSYLSAAQNYLMQNYDKLMSESNDYIRRRTTWKDEIAGKKPPAKQKPPAKRKPRPQTDYEKMRKERKEQGLDEEVEQIDEGNKENKKKKNEYVSNIIKKKLSSEVLPSLKYGRRELKKEEVEQMNEVSRSLAGRYIGAASEEEKKKRKEGQEFVQQLKDAGMEGFSAPLYHKGPHYGRASRENMINLAVNKLTNPDFPVSNRVKVPATESVEQMDEAKWRDPKLKGKTFMNPRAVNRAPKDQSEYYGGDMNNPGELRGDEKIPLDREGKPKLSTDPLADRANLPKRTRGGQKFPRVGPLKQAIMNKEEVERLDELSLETLDKYKRAAAQSAKKADASGDYAKGHKRFKGIIQATKKQFKQDIMKEAKKDPREYGFEGDMAMSQLRSIMNHTQQLLGMLQPDMDLPEWVQLKITLAQDYIETAADYMQTELQKEEVEHLDEISDAAKLEYLKSAKKDIDARREAGRKTRDEINAEAERQGIPVQVGIPYDHKLHGIRSRTGRVAKVQKELINKILKKEEVQQVNEKLTKDMSAGEIISDFVHSDDPKFDGKSKEERKRMALGAYYSMHPEKSKNESIENTMYNNIMTKLEEGRGRPPKEGSEAWKRRQAASAAGEIVDETPGLGDQLLKHQDQGERGSGMIKFKDGSSHKVSAQQRDKALRFMRSLVGPGKNPDVRDATIAKMSKSHDHFLQHIGEKPMQPEKRHPMSAQKD